MGQMNVRTGAPLAQDAPYYGGVVINYAGGDQQLATNCRGIFVGGAGNLAVVFVDGTALTLTGLVAGTVYRLCLKTIVQTGSTATSCVALL